jgi:hypothetical protein
MPAISILAIYTSLKGGVVHCGCHVMPLSTQLILPKTGALSCITSSYHTFAGSYKVIATGQTVAIHPSSVLCGKKAECVVFNELVRTSRQYARDALLIDARWLPELAPAYFARQQANQPAA